MYLNASGPEGMRDNNDVFRQISKDEYIFVSNFNEVSKMAFNFSMEKFDGDKLKYKISSQIVSNGMRQQKITPSLITIKGKVGKFGDIIEFRRSKGHCF